MRKFQLPEQFELQAFKAAIAFTLLLAAVLILSAWWSHRSHRLSQAQVVQPIPTVALPTHFPNVEPDSGVNEMVDALATVAPTVVSTDVPQSTNVATEYPELVAQVDAAVKSAFFEPLPMVRNSTDDGYIFRWQAHFEPPDLEGIAGGEIYAPYTKPYRYTHTFKLHALNEQAERPWIVRAINTNGQAEVKDSELAPGEYEWTVSGWLHTRPYDNMTDWMTWQPFEVTNH